MTKPVLVDDDALRELARAARWYERERAGLGDELVDVIEGVLRALPSGTPHALPVPGIANERRVRRVLVERFPYAVVFVETDAAFHVVAVAHLKRRPRYWSGRLRSVHRV
jgi:toxin ParE1/3/4